MKWHLIYGYWLFIILCNGVLLRLAYYIENLSVWHDEAAMIVNVLFLDYGEMFGPLIHSEAAPPLFLVVERLLVDVAGDSELTLRFLPCLASITSLLLFQSMAKRSVGWHSTLVAVILMAVSDRLLFHSVRSKSLLL